MPKVKVSVCGEHLYAEPEASQLLFVLLHPASPQRLRRLGEIALCNGYNGFAVTWLCSARVSTRKALMLVPAENRTTATGRDHLRKSIALARDVVAAWGELPGGTEVPDIRRPLCLGIRADGAPVSPTILAKLRRYER